MAATFPLSARLEVSNPVKNTTATRLLFNCDDGNDGCDVSVERYSQDGKSHVNRQNFVMHFQRFATTKSLR